MPSLLLADGVDLGAVGVPHDDLVAAPPATGHRPPVKAMRSPSGDRTEPKSANSVAPMTRKNPKKSGALTPYDWCARVD